MYEALGKQLVAREVLGVCFSHAGYLFEDSLTSPPALARVLCMLYAVLVIGDRL